MTERCRGRMEAGADNCGESEGGKEKEQKKQA
jgi:hypothetical protein